MRHHIPIAWLSGVAPVLILVCGVLGASGGRASQLFERLEIDDQKLSPQIVTVFRNDLDALEDLAIEAPRGSDFENIFGGTSSKDVARYLGERIHYVSLDPDEESDSNLNSDTGEPVAVTYAANYGPSFWEWLWKTRFKGKRKRRAASPEFVAFKGLDIALNSPRTGFIVLGQGYLSPEAGRITRLETLVHEARHSDCAELPLMKDVESYISEDYESISESALACNHIHVNCPAGHPMAGEQACDRHPWGAYSVAAVFSEAIEKYCTNCSESDRTEAVRLRSDNWSRLSPEIQEQWNARELAAPNMESL